MKVLKWAVSPLASAVGLLKPKAAKTPAPIRPAMRDEARAAIDEQDARMRRRGGAADIVTGAYGAEAPAGGKATLGS